MGILEIFAMTTFFRKFLCPAIFAVLASCAEKEEVFVPGSNGGGSGNGGTEPPALYEPDYSGLTAANHPRLLMDYEECEILKDKLAAADDELLMTLHNGVMGVANSNAVLNGEEIVYELDVSGRRILEQAKESTKRILYLSYAYRVTGDTKYSKAAEKVIETMCNFPDWNAARHFLDPAEICTGIAIGYDWLYDVLSADTKAKVEKCIQDYAFYPAQNRIWNLNFYESLTNWNGACNQGLVAGALAIYEKAPAVSKEIIEAAVESVPKYIEAAFSPSGCYEEGASYWRNASIQQALMFTNLKETIGTDFGMSEIPGWKETSKYMLFMYGTTDQTFNYSDSDMFISAVPGQWYFASAFDNPAAIYNEVSLLKSGKYFSSTNTDVTRMIPLAIVFFNKMAEGIRIDDISAPSERMFSGKSDPDGNGLDLCLIHTDWTNGLTDKYLGIKGGKASSSHAHMDAGSFVYDAYGVRWSHDLGLQPYTSLENYLKAQGGNLWDMGQNSMRWDVLRLNNKYHSTLTINDHKHQVDGYAALVETYDNAREIGARFDLTPVFGSDVSSCYRTVKLVGEDLVVTDEITAPKTARASVSWRMVTKADVTVGKDYIRLQSGNRTMYLKASSTGPGIEYMTWDADPVLPYDADNPGVTIVGFTGSVTIGQKVTFTTVLSPEL